MKVPESVRQTMKHLHEGVGQARDIMEGNIQLQQEEVVNNEVLPSTYDMSLF